MIKIFTISDTHFGHANIIQYSNRPFVNVEEMDAEMIKRWNSVVTDDDIVVHVGDFAWNNKQYGRNIFEQLRGQKYLVKGNHDGSKSRMLDVGFLNVYNHLYMDDLKYLFIHNPDSICHVREEHDECNILFYGHTHEDFVKIRKGFNVCVEHHNYTPFCIGRVHCWVY